MIEEFAEGRHPAAGAPRGVDDCPLILQLPTTMACRSGAATPLTFFIADCESDGGRRGRSESDQKLGEKK